MPVESEPNQLERTAEGGQTPHIHTGRAPVKTYYDVPRQVDAICHGADFFKGVEHGPVGAAHGPPVLVLGVTEFVKTSCTCSLRWKTHCNCISRGTTMTEDVVYCDCRYSGAADVTRQ